MFPVNGTQYCLYAGEIVSSQLRQRFCYVSARYLNVFKYDRSACRVTEQDMLHCWISSVVGLFVKWDELMKLLQKSAL